MTLVWAGQEDRVILSQDVSTMTAYAYARMVDGLPIAGVFADSRLCLSVGLSMTYSCWPSVASPANGQDKCDTCHYEGKQMRKAQVESKVSVTIRVGRGRTSNER
jgi:hypothetical protein